MKHKLLCTMIALAGLICSSAQTPAWAQWQLQTTISGNPALTSVKAVSRDVAWTCSFNGAIYRTIDGGKTWNPTGRASQPLGCIEALDATTAFAGGLGTNLSGNASLFRTINGGQSWQVVYTAVGAKSAWAWIHFFDAQNGIAMSDPPVAGGNFLIIKTSDGGTTWAPISNLPSANATEFGILNCFDFYNKLNGWFGTAPSGPGGSGGRVFRTTDAGNTWTGFASGNTAAVSSVRFISPLIGIRVAFSTPPLLTRSVDGGQTWTTLNNLPISNIQWLTTTTGVNTINSNQLWISGDTNAPFILSSVDGGITWQQQAIVGTVINSIYHLSAVSFGAMSDSVQAWGVTLNQETYASGGQILTYRNRIGIVTSVKGQASLPVEYDLSQNYPNPFNPSTSIRYALPIAQFVTLKFFNLAGQEVATLVRQQQTAGEHTISWNAKNLPSGVYMYRLKTGEFSETKKMILMR
ncbi:MAG: Ycf48-like protein [Syntrophorhabdaceae bacterium]|nr:Ycf48-like protein [Syntrophorhabdaceae bacterium]